MYLVRGVKLTAQLGPSIVRCAGPSIDRYTGPSIVLRAGPSIDRYTGLSVVSCAGDQNTISSTMPTHGCRGNEALFNLHGQQGACRDVMVMGGTGPTCSRRQENRTLFSLKKTKQKQMFYTSRLNLITSHLTYSNFSCIFFCILSIF